MNSIENSLEGFFRASFVLMAVPLSFISLGELVNVKMSLAQWEGANYLVPVIPLYLFLISSRYSGGKPMETGRTLRHAG
jgi:hypothetical protein